MPRNAQRQYPQKSVKQEKKTTSKKKDTIFELQNEQLVKVQPDVRKKFSKHDINKISPLTENQAFAFREWFEGQHLVLEGLPGTGKSFIALFLALQTILDPDTEQDKIIIVRSATPTKDVGFLPGDLDEKLMAYEIPYIQICDQLFKWKNSYSNLKEIGLIDFLSTSYLRGTTFDNSVIIFDEFQNGTNSEIDTVLTRTGDGSRLIISGDTIYQNDIGSKSGGDTVMKTLKNMHSVSSIYFTIDDIVRSGFVKEYLIAKHQKQ